MLTIDAATIVHLAASKRNFEAGIWRLCACLRTDILEPRTVYEGWYCGAKMVVPKAEMGGAHRIPH